MKNAKRVLALLLCLMMVITAVPMGAVADSVKAFAAELTTASTADDAEDAKLTEALAKAKTYIDGITINNSSNDPATVVKNFGTHFTWDNEKREDSKTYLYDWSYYNGVVFEGIEYLYENSPATEENKEAYKKYVTDYMSSLIALGGTWATCTNNTGKECAGYKSTHGADCYKTASLLLDAYEMTGDSRYLTMAATLYADLDTAAKSYSLANAGNNFRHTWASDSTPDLWLDGLYMILPFRAEYAKYTKDTEELDLIVSRLKWVSENMYNESNGLFYHAADSKSSNSDTYWLRSIGWYAAAIVDVMDSMSGTNLEAMKAQLVKLVDGMLKYQRDSGLWTNAVIGDIDSTVNYEEVSGTALLCYAIMKAVNNGWLEDTDGKYSDVAKNAMIGISNNYLTTTTLSNICFKGTPGASNAEKKNNEGKGVGPFIMFYAEMLEYVNEQAETPEASPSPEATATPAPSTEPTPSTSPETPSSENIEINNTTITVDGATNVAGSATVKAEEESLVNEFAEEKNYAEVLLYDISATLAEGAKATLTFPIPEGWDADRIVGISVEGTEVKEIEGKYEDGKFTFTVDHFSAKGIALTAEMNGTSVSGTGNLVGGTVYTLNTDGVIDTTKTYIIANLGSNGNGYALEYKSSNFNNSEASRESITVANGMITKDDYSYIAWSFSDDTEGTISNNGKYIRLNGTSNILGKSARNLIIESKGNGAYQISYVEDGGWLYEDTTYYLVYDSSGWVRTEDSSAVVYLYEETSSSGEAVTFTVTPKSATLQPNGTVNLTGAVTVAGETVNLSDCTIIWDSLNDDVATVSGGTVTGVADGTANITATLSAVNGTALQENIVLTIPVTVQSKTVTSMQLVSPVGTVYVGSGATVNTGAKIKVIYDNNENDYEHINVTVGMLTDANGNAVDTSAETVINNLKVIYNNNEISTSFTLHVVEKPDMNYPEYPHEGSVQVDKFIADYSQFQDLGVAEINLTTSGLPAIAPVDVILVTDLSNSMAWSVGGRTDAKSHEATKMYDLAQSVCSFADTFLYDDDGNKLDNTISLVTFGGYDADYTEYVYTDYADPTQTLLLGSNDADTVKNTINNVRVLADDALNIGTSTTGYYLSFDGGKTYGENYGNTNYDHAFMQTSKAIEALKAQYNGANNISYAESGRVIYVIFMTDGAPSNYDGVYYNYKTNTQERRADVDSTWINESGVETTYTMGNNRAQYQEGPWYEYIAGGTYDTTTKTIPGNPLYWATQVYNTPGVADVFSIGFDIDNGGFSSMTFTLADGRPLAKVLEKLVEGKTLDVYEANDSTALNQVYEKLASELKYAASNAYFVDQMGESFDIQMASKITKLGVPKSLSPVPQITISTQKIYTTDDIIPEGSNLGDSYGSVTKVEEVKFNEAGTEAYSNLSYEKYVTSADGTVTKSSFTAGNNIVINEVIYGKYFWYNKNTTAVMIDTNGDGETDYSLPGETFYWDIGTINNQKFIMSYYVYLEGSAEGNAKKGTYATNNYATLYYDNWLGNDAEQSVDSPTLSWESAAVYYGFYLVDENGVPVTNRATGETGTFDNAVKVTSRIFYDEILLNSGEYVTSINVASTSKPVGYEVYDKGATYTLQVDSKDQNTDGSYETTLSGWTIEIGKDENGKTLPATTYVTDYRGNEYTLLNAGIKDDDFDEAGVDYTSTTVWFAVKWVPKCIDDVVVIDYGLPVDIGVLENDMFGTAGTLSGLGLTSYEGNKSAKQFSTTTLEQSATGVKYGSISMVNTEKGMEVRYTPESMEMPSFDKFAYEVRYNNVNTGQFEYYSGNVTVIPATTIYYEDSFVDLATYSSDGTKTADDWSLIGTVDTTSTQAEDRPDYYSLPAIDANNVYGYDSAYAEMSQYSLGSAKKVTVDANSYATASFEFYGTGFDIVSLTSNQTGVLVVQVFDANGEMKASRVVDTYYGYNYDVSTKKWSPSEDTSDNAIYQIPVMQVENLSYGKYRAVLTVSYYDALNNVGSTVDGKFVGDGSYDFYLDAIRIYDPAGVVSGEANETIENAYNADNEAYPTYFELRDKILKVKDYNADVTNAVANGIVYIDGMDGASIADYTSYGPNNELYLTKDNAVAFTMTAPAKSGYEVDKIHIGVKNLGGNGSVKVYDATIAADKVSAKTINTATDMYYDITALNGKTVVILNSGDAIISITNIKVTYKVATTTADEPAVAMFSISRPAAELAIMSLTTEDVEDDTTSTPEIDDTTSEPEVDDTTSTPEADDNTSSTPEDDTTTSAPETSEPEVNEPETDEPAEDDEAEDKESDAKEKLEEAIKKATEKAEKVLKQATKVAKTIGKAISKYLKSILN